MLLFTFETILTSLQSLDASALSAGAASSANSEGQRTLDMVCRRPEEAGASLLGQLLQRVYAASNAFFLTVIVLSTSLPTGSNNTNLCKPTFMLLVTQNASCPVHLTTPHNRLRSSRLS